MYKQHFLSWSCKWDSEFIPICSFSTWKHFCTTVPDRKWHRKSHSHWLTAGKMCVCVRMHRMCSSQIHGRLYMLFHLNNCNVVIDVFTFIVVSVSLRIHYLLRNTSYYKDLLYVLLFTDTWKSSAERKHQTSKESSFIHRWWCLTCRMTHRWHHKLLKCEMTYFLILCSKMLYICK